MNANTVYVTVWCIADLFGKKSLKSYESDHIAQVLQWSYRMSDHIA